MRRILIALILVVFQAQTAASQEEATNDPATLVADDLRIEGDGILVAEGEVEVFYGTTTLRASRVTYDEATGQLVIDGPIRLTDGTGTILVAQQAELDRDLTNGILYSARLVLDQQMQMAAAEIQRQGDRYINLRRVTASSCEVCAGGPPLWEIRARGVVHDRLERQIYFEGAQFHVAGVPIFYFPRLRLPDPSVVRDQGFLFPELRTTSLLGSGPKLPYFIPINEYSDVLLTPYVSSGTTTLEARYRRNFYNGWIRFDGAFTARDDILGDQSRGYGFLRGGFRLPREYSLTFDLEYTTDPTYGLDYDYFGKDRLDSQIALSRVSRDSFFRTRAIYYETLREQEQDIQATLPSGIVELTFTHRLPTGPFGGIAWFTTDNLIVNRESDNDPLGRDVSRINGDLGWARSWVTGQGMILETQLGLSLDAYSVRNDSSFDSYPFRTTPRAAATLRWPFTRRTENGSQQLLEPIAMLAWSRAYGDAVPNEDSLVVAFDEGNLFSFSRYPGIDARELGWRANLGVNWRHKGVGGSELALSAGRVIWIEDKDQFAAGTGLEGDISNWLVAAQYRLNDRLSLMNRTLFEDDLSVTRNETRVDYFANWGRISTGYYWQVPIPSEDAPDQISEWQLDTQYTLNQNWSGTAYWRYDFQTGQAADAGIGLTYQNECVRLNLSLSRRYTSSTQLEPTTDFGVSVSLNGFGANGSGAKFRHVCSG